ncbi:hypothetical protein DSM112329_04148 [Paraconexibacter sp. AEG42_29]|uniref:Thioesterase domain-containing protein n=1 Tax=Paraconexibacter sp. AEG42_29 TaxID=2997339 RepID=A0AAU7B0V5_9ACTN
MSIAAVVGSPHGRSNAPEQPGAQLHGPKTLRLLQLRVVVPPSPLNGRMDLTRVATEMLAAIPATTLFGIDVIAAGDGTAELTVAPSPAALDALGCLHTSGLVALVDSTSMAAIISAAPDEDHPYGLVPAVLDLQMTLVRPARGRLTARCVLGEAATRAAVAFYDRERRTTTIATRTQITDGEGLVVGDGRATWALHRTESPLDTSDHVGRSSGSGARRVRAPGRLRGAAR